MMLWRKKWAAVLWVGLSTFVFGSDDERHPDHEGVAFRPQTPIAPHTAQPRQLDPSHMTAVVNVADEPTPYGFSSSMRRRVPLGPPTSLTQELLGVRNEVVKKWSRTLMTSQFGWYRAGNVAEAGSQICQVLTPVLSGCAAGFKNDTLALTAMCFGIVGVALARFSHYAHSESAERGEAANEFLAREGVPQIVVIKDANNSDAS